MNTIGTLIATMDSDYLLLPKKEQSDLVNAVLLYVFNAVDSQELSDHFKDILKWTGQQCIDFRNALKGKGYIQKNFKFYLYAEINGKEIDTEDYEIRPDDVAFAERLFKSKAELANKLRNHCKGRARVGYKPRCMHEFDRGLTKVVPELEVTASKAVSKKLKFVTQSGQGNKRELVQELLVSGIYAMYKAYPEIDDLLHLKNIGITAVGNRTQNLIQEFVAKSRKRVEKNADGTFSGTTLSMNTMDVDTVFSRDSGYGTGGSIITCNALMAGIDGNCVEHERPGDVDRQRDLTLTVERMFAKMQSERARRFTSILMGIHDPGFSEHLGMPNDEASDKMPYKEYCIKAREYMGVPLDKARVFVQKLRTELRDYGA